MTFKKVFLNYFPKSQLLYKKQNFLALFVVSKTTKQCSADRRNSKNNVRDLETLIKFMQFISMQVYFASLDP